MMCCVVCWGSHPSLSSLPPPFLSFLPPLPSLHGTRHKQDGGLDQCPVTPGGAEESGRVLGSSCILGHGAMG